MVVKNCYWQPTRTTYDTEQGPSSDFATWVFLPFGVAVDIEDWLIKGSVKIQNPSAVSIRNAGGLRVTTVRHLDYGGLKHVEVVCS